VGHRDGLAHLLRQAGQELNELEAATLIGMLKGTSYYNPVLNPERARSAATPCWRRWSRPASCRGALRKLKAQPLKLDFERQPEFNGPAPHLAEYLRRWLLEWADKHDYNIYADGLVVRTTLDSRLQAYANEAVKRQGDALQAVADVEWSRSARRRLRHRPAELRRPARQVGPSSTSGTPTRTW
jgi:penicillin-binding protein 1A